MITLLNIDCMEYMKNVPDKYFDLAIVDPPYGISEEGGRNLADRPTAKWKNPHSKIYKSFDDDNIPDKKYFNELFRISKNQIIWGGNHFTEFLNPSNGWVIWNKEVDIKEYLSMAELAWTSFDRKINMFNYLWAGFKKKHQIERFHPTQKPIDLYKWLLKNYAKPEFKIIDTHGGSMSSVIACYEFGIAEMICCEIDKDYYEAGVKRFENHKAQLKLQYE